MNVMCMLYDYTLNDTIPIRQYLQLKLKLNNVKFIRVIPNIRKI